MAYLLFAGDTYYPEGGANDLQGKFDTIESAIAAHDPKKYEWANVLCIDSLNVVRQFYNHAWHEDIIFSEFIAEQETKQ